jgi:hypothetical protein
LAAAPAAIRQLPTRLKFDKSPGKLQQPKRKFSEEPPLSAGADSPRQVRGEMDLFNIDQLINVQDLQDCQRR